MMGVEWPAWIMHESDRESQTGKQQRREKEFNPKDDVDEMEEEEVRRWATTDRNERWQNRGVDGLNGMDGGDSVKATCWDCLQTRAHPLRRPSTPRAAACSRGCRPAG
jgi:hypothetical protein